MLVDDEKDILAILSRGLEAHGFKVAGFSDPARAVQHFENGGDSFGVVVSDIRMPGMTGFQLARRVKELHPDIRIILISAFEMSKAEFDMVMPSTHVDNLLCKPLAPSRLIEAIEALD